MGWTWYQPQQEELCFVLRLEKLCIQTKNIPLEIDLQTRQVEMVVVAIEGSSLTNHQFFTLSKEKTSFLVEENCM
jgi:hypothetical protein